MLYRNYNITAELASAAKYDIDEDGNPTEWLDDYSCDRKNPINGYNIDAEAEAENWEDVLDGFADSLEEAKARIDTHLDNPERCVDCHTHSKALQARVYPQTV